MGGFNYLDHAIPCPSVELHVGFNFAARATAELVAERRFY